jgi:hypothetical protein
MSKTKWIGLLLIIGFLLLTSLPKRAVLYLAGDSLDWHTRRLAGWHAVDCGKVMIRQNPEVATNCALKAQAEERPFRIRYQIMGYDSEVAEAVVETPAGHLYMLTFVGDPSGRSGMSFLRQTTAQIACPEPIHLYVNPKGRINCFQPQLAPPSGGLLSPNAEAY